jgi:hypothetical protein
MIHGDNTKLMSFWRYRKIDDNVQHRALGIMNATALRVKHFANKQ